MRNLILTLGLVITVATASVHACDGDGGCNNRPPIPGEQAEGPPDRGLPGQGAIRTRGLPRTAAQQRQHIADLILAGRLAEAADRLDILAGDREPAAGTKLACDDSAGCNHAPGAPSAEAVHIACDDGAGCNNRDESRQTLATGPARAPERVACDGVGCDHTSSLPAKEPVRLACDDSAGCNHAPEAPDRVACNSDNCNAPAEPYIVAMRGGSKAVAGQPDRQTIARLVQEGKLPEARARLADVLGRKSPR